MLTETLQSDVQCEAINCIRQAMYEACRHSNFKYSSRLDPWYNNFRAGKKIIHIIGADCHVMIQTNLQLKANILEYGIKICYKFWYGHFH